MTMARIVPKALSELQVSRHMIPPFAHLPNSSATSKPLLIYHSCFPTPLTPSAVESHLQSTGVVTPQWRYSMYTTTHFHSTTHEVLCIVSGSARLCFGGEHNPDRAEETLKVGDVVVIPAGVGHRLLEEIEKGFQMVGAYLVGNEQWDMCYGKGSKEEEEKVKRIGKLKWFERDPIYGDQGPVLDGKE